MNLPSGSRKINNRGIAKTGLITAKLCLATIGLKSGSCFLPVPKERISVSKVPDRVGFPSSGNTCVTYYVKASCIVQSKPAMSGEMSYSKMMYRCWLGPKSQTQTSGFRIRVELIRLKSLLKYTKPYICKRGYKG